MAKQINMIRYVKHNEINKEKWDQCIDNSINSMIYAYSWYLDIISKQWDALVENDYESVMPLPYKRKAGIYKLYQPFFTQQLGVFSQKILNPDIVNSFIKNIPPKFLFIDINLNWLNKVNNKKYTIEQRKTYLLDLIEPYEKIRKSYSANNLRNVKKAGKNGLFYQEDSGPIEIIDAFKNNRAKLFPEIKEYHYKSLQHLVFTAISKGAAKIIKAYDCNNNFCAGIIFLVNNKRAVFIFSGANPSAKENGAMFGLIDYFIRKNEQSELTLDFEGSMNKNLARFYSGFGSKECLFLRIKTNPFSFLKHK